MNVGHWLGHGKAVTYTSIFGPISTRIFIQARPECLVSGNRQALVVCPHRTCSTDDVIFMVKEQLYKFVLTRIISTNWKHRSNEVSRLVAICSTLQAHIICNSFFNHPVRRCASITGHSTHHMSSSASGLTTRQLQTNVTRHRVQSTVAHIMVYVQQLGVTHKSVCMRVLVLSPPPHAQHIIEFQSSSSA